MSDILNTITNYIVLGSGVGTIIYILLFIWEKTLFKLLKLTKVHHKIFKYYQNRKKFEEWRGNQ